jgi:hypothetical protein
MLMEKFRDLIGNLIHDFPAFSMVPQANYATSAVRHVTYVTEITPTNKQHNFNICVIFSVVEL